MLGSNEMGPVNTEEYAFCTLILIGFNIINAQIFGEIAVLITVFEKKQTNYQEKLDNANTAMSNLGIPIDLVEGVHEYLQKT